ncbi:MAG: FxsA family protein [Methylococcaceae bacterium]|nr:FxsA family protein [Methylococcaceae bacterium]
MNIAQAALVALLMLPILEIYLLIQIGGAIGLIPTVVLLIAAASVGTYLLQTQGWSTWMRVQASLARGELPAAEMVDGAVIVAGGALLLLPGFLSDIAGLLCLLPPTRKIIAAYLLRNRFGVPGGPPPSQAGGPTTIEGEYRREE